MTDKSDKSEKSEKLERDLQKVFEFVVKNRENTLEWPNADIRKFIRWALYYRKLFIVWAPAGAGQRIAALGIAWRTEHVAVQDAPLTFENTEFGNNLYVYQVIVHPDFSHTGALFQMLSLALWRYPGVERVFWFPDSRKGQEFVHLSMQRLLKMLALQVKPNRVRKYEGKDKSWQKVAHSLVSPMLRPVR